MLRTAVFELVQQFYHANEVGNVATAVSASVARWLSPQPAKSRQEKLLDPAKNHVTNFQLKSP